MSVFNNETRAKNALKISVIGAITVIAKLILGFGYRTIFLRFLSSEYLGINGLFASILQLLSLAELGITTAIAYRFYEPISKGNSQYVGMLMNFFKVVYRFIAGIILAFGLIIAFFLPCFIKNTSEIPRDINLYVVYFLFLINTLSSYVFSYKLILLSADQKNYINSIVELIYVVIQYASQILILILSRNYTLTLAVGIVITLIINYIASVWVSRQYEEVFSVKKLLPREDRKKIFDDTRACMCHKIGTTVLVSTDNFVLSRMVSLMATGLYSNYTMVTSNVQNLLGQVLGNFTSSIGNAYNKIGRDECYKLFNKMYFMTMWIASVTSSCLFLVIDDFIRICLGEEYVLSDPITAALCVQLYFSLTRIVNGSFINADGLFVKDKYRPLVEATLNLFFSVWFTYLFGIIGVCLGTIISALLTVQWREPYILYKYSFHKNIRNYWSLFLSFTLCTFLTSLILYFVKSYAFVYCNKMTLGILVLEATAGFLFANLVLLFRYGRREEFIYWFRVAKTIILKMK